MRREDFDVRTRTGTTGRPVLAIEYDGPRETLRARLAEVVTPPIGPDDLECAVRPAPATAGGAILAITGAHTGGYLLETPVDPAPIQTAVQTARANDAATVAVVLAPADGDPVEFDTRTVLQFTPSGALERESSLLPEDGSSASGGRRGRGF